MRTTGAGKASAGEGGGMSMQGCCVGGGRVGLIPGDDRRRLLGTPSPSERSSSVVSSETSFADFSSEGFPSRPSSSNGSRATSSSGIPRGSRSRRVRCVYCGEKFTTDDNGKGACREAPDKGLKTLKFLTCYPCAESLSYHCLRDNEGDYVQPCSCSNRDGRKLVRWTGLTALSLCFPCLCFFPCCMMLFDMGRKCGVCGGRHESPVDTNNGGRASISSAGSSSGRRRSSGNFTSVTSTASSTTPLTSGPTSIAEEP